MSANVSEMKSSRKFRVAARLVVSHQVSVCPTTRPSFAKRSLTSRQELTMRILWLAAALFIALTSTGSAAATQAGTGNVFEVNARVYVADRLVAAPSFSVVSGAETAISVSGNQAIGLRFTVSPDEARPSVPEAVVLSSRLYFLRSGRWTLVSAPVIRTVEGAVARQSSRNTTVYGNGGYAIEFEVNRTDRAVSPEDLAAVEDCPVWKELANDGPLFGVSVRGLLHRVSAVQDGNEVGDPDLPYCYTSGNMRCCSSVTGTCCSDGVTGNSCCT